MVRGPLAASLAAYRVVQEALTNAVKHRARRWAMMFAMSSERCPSPARVSNWRMSSPSLACRRSAKCGHPKVTAYSNKPPWASPFVR